MSLVCSVPGQLDLHPYKGPSKYLEQFWSYGLNTEICGKKIEKIPISKKLGTGITWKQRPWRNNVWNLKHPGWILCEKIKSAKG